MNLVNAFVFSLLELLLAGPAKGQTPNYANEQQLLGAAAVTPLSTYKTLQLLVTKCGIYSEALRLQGMGELSLWEERHHAYLEENLIIQSRLMRHYTTQAEKQSYRAMLERQLPSAVQRQYEILAMQINLAVREDGKEEICRAYFRAIATHKFDLKNNEPVVAAFLDRQISYQSKIKRRHRNKVRD